jgi:hypothetical protein
MTHAIVRRLTVLAGVLALSASAVLAAQGDDQTVRHSVTVTQTALLAGLPVEKGKYEAEITGGAERVLVLKRDNKEIARARVASRDLNTPAKYDRVDLRTESNGAKGIATIMFKGDRISYDVLDDQKVAVWEKP